MVKSAATTVTGYLQELPAERRAVVSAVRDVILRNLPEGYVETMSWGMISYEIPLQRYPDTYNKQPACYAGLAAQKNHYAVYLMALDDGKREQLADAFEKLGRKMDLGGSCLRFKKLEDIPLETVGRLIASMPPEDLILWMQAARRR